MQDLQYCLEWKAVNLFREQKNNFMDQHGEFPNICVLGRRAYIGICYYITIASLPKPQRDSLTEPLTEMELRDNFEGVNLVLMPDADQESMIMLLSPSECLTRQCQ